MKMILWLYHLLKKTEKILHLLIKELQNYADRFQAYFRMSLIQFDMLLEPRIQKNSTNVSESIYPEQLLEKCVLVSSRSADIQAT